MNNTPEPKAPKADSGDFELKLSAVLEAQKQLVAKLAEVQKQFLPIFDAEEINPEADAEFETLVDSVAKEELAAFNRQIGELAALAKTDVEQESVANIVHATESSPGFSLVHNDDPRFQ